MIDELRSPLSAASARARIRAIPWPLMLLAGVGGAIDATTWTAAGVFGANMTGNAVLGAIALTRNAPGALLPFLIALGAYVGGLAVEALLEARASTPAQRNGAAQNALWLETLALIGFAFVLTQHGIAWHDRLVIVCASFALGLQSGAVRASFGGIVAAGGAERLASIGHTLATPAGLALLPGDRRSIVVWITYVAAAFGIASLAEHLPQAKTAVPVVCAIAIAIVGLAMNVDDEDPST